jgi:hypothetical protein
MRNMHARPLTAALLVLIACGPAAVAPELTEMITMAQSGAHRSWSGEAAPHPSAGPHATVRTFLNEPLLLSLRSGADMHPAGSIAVKELYDGEKLTGYAIDWKGEDGQWRFFEGFEPSLNEYFYVGTENGCAGCHRPGKDFLLTPASAIVDAGVR